MSSHVFISYSRKDKARVSTFVEDLQVNNFVVWQDVTDLLGGENWWESIENAIEQADAVLVFWSINAKESKYVKREVEHAIRANKIIIPVLLDRTKLPKNLAHIHVIEKSKEKDLRDALEPIGTKIKRKEMGFNLDLPMRKQTIRYV